MFFEKASTTKVTVIHNFCGAIYIVEYCIWQSVVRLHRGCQLSAIKNITVSVPKLLPYSV